MKRAVGLASLLVLQWSWILRGLPDTLIHPQENFDVDQFMGRWYEVAVVSSCPLYMQNKRRNPAIVALELKHGASQGNVTMTATSVRNHSCKQTSTNYGSTSTPGRFFYHVARLRADVDCYVVDTNYDEYAMMVFLSTDRPSGNKTTIVKLYSRTVDVRAAVMGDFKALVRQRGMSDDTIIVNKNEGECDPDEQVPGRTPQSRG